MPFPARSVIFEKIQLMHPLSPGRDIKEIGNVVKVWKKRFLLHDSLSKNTQNGITKKFWP